MIKKNEYKFRHICGHCGESKKFRAEDEVYKHSCVNKCFEVIPYMWRPFTDMDTPNIRFIMQIPIEEKLISEK